MAKARVTRRSPTQRAPAGRGRKPTGRFDATREFEQALERTNGTSRYVLRLYVTGTSPRSQAAIANIRMLCDTHLKGRYDLEVIDIYQQPTLAQGEQIIAAPTLIKKMPVPLRKMVGDLSNSEWVLMGLDIKKSAAGKDGRK